MTSILFGLAIGCYIVWVIRRKIKDMKNGNYCGCGCQDCAKSCSSKKEE